MKNKIIFILLLATPLLTNAATKVPNLLKANSFPELANQMISGLLGITGAMALFFVVQGGFIWITSAGNAEKVKSGKETIMWALLGLIAVFLSYFVVDVVYKAIGVVS